MILSVPKLHSRFGDFSVRGTITCSSLLLLAAVIYWPVHQFGFLNYDDPSYVWQNRFVQAGFTRQSLHFAFTSFLVGNWNPLVWISFLLDRQLFGATAAGLHIENVAWHALGGILLWILLAKSTGAPVRSWIVAALFVCHPMHVESVAWISERKDVLSTPLLLAAMLAWVRYCKSPADWRRIAAYALALLLFTLSLMAKATGVTLPLLLLLLDYWPLRRLRLTHNNASEWVKAIAEKIPLVLITLVFAMISIRAQQSGGATEAAASLPMLDRVENAVVCYVIYLVKLAVPTDLAAFYPHPGSRPLAAAAAAGGMLLLISWIAFHRRADMPWLLVGWLWFLIALLPMIGLVQIGGQAMADRYSYLPSIGIFVMVVWGVTALLARLHLSNSSRAGWWLSTGLTVAILATLSILCRRQVWYWKDDDTLFTHSFEVTGPTPVACFAMGVAALGRGDAHAARDDFTQVIQQDPGNDKAFELLGTIWSGTDPAKALLCYQQAVALNPPRIDYRIALAAELTRVNDLPSLSAAADQLRQVLQIDPDNPQARAGLADLKVRTEHLMRQSQNQTDRINGGNSVR